MGTKREEEKRQGQSRRDFLKKAGAGALAAAFWAGLDRRAARAGEGRLPSLEAGPAPEPIPVIDVHAHCEPVWPRFMETAKGAFLQGRGPVKTLTHRGVTALVFPEVGDVERQMPILKQAGVSKSLLSFSMELELVSQKAFFLPDGYLMETINSSMARTVAKYPGRLAFMAMVNPFHGKAVQEAARCLDHLGAHGLNIGTSWDGRYPDDPRTEPLWEFAQSRGQAVFLHPPFAPVGHGRMDRYKLDEALGRPMDTTMAVARMICSGVFDRYPNLQVVVPHCGALLPGVLDRLDFGIRLGYEGLPESHAPVCKRRPSEYVQTNLVADTMGFSPLKLRHCLELFGPDRVVFGSDFAPVNLSPKEQIDLVAGLGLDRKTQEKIFWKNAKRIFKL